MQINSSKSNLHSVVNFQYEMWCVTRVLFHNSSPWPNSPITYIDNSYDLTDLSIIYTQIRKSVIWPLCPPMFRSLCQFTCSTILEFFSCHIMIGNEKLFLLFEIRLFQYIFELYILCETVSKSGLLLCDDTLWSFSILFTASLMRDELKTLHSRINYLQSVTEFWSRFLSLQIGNGTSELRMCKSNLIRPCRYIHIIII